MDEARIVVSKDGPLTVTGDIPLVRLAAAPEDEWRIEESLPPRASYALCRCGRSRMAPFCDYKHQRGFDGSETAPHAAGGGASVTPGDASPAIGFVRGPDRGHSGMGPLWLRGAIVLVSADGTAYAPRTGIALCRCGNSRSKPFCDGSHAELTLQRG